VLGRGGGALEKMLPPFRLGVGGRIGTGRQWMPWVHVEDLVSILLFAATQTDLRGPLNGTAPEPVRNSDFTEALAHAMHRPAMMPVPTFGLKLLMGEMADVTLHSQRVVPAALEKAGFDFRFADVSSALADVLGQ
jgi:uncharacterized protein (TIGR01777 family)